MRSKMRWERIWSQLEAWCPWLMYRAVLRKLGITLLMMVIIRTGHYIAIPGVDQNEVATGLAVSAADKVVRSFSGRTCSLAASCADLGITPFISASLFMSVLLVPGLAKLLTSMTGVAGFEKLEQARKEGKAGEAEINRYMYTIAGTMALMEGLYRAWELLPFASVHWSAFMASTALVLTAFASITHHCANMITAYGISNGSTLVICMSIITEYARTLHQAVLGLASGVVPASQLCLALAAYVVLALGVVLLSKVELRLPIIQYRTLLQESMSGSGGGSGSLYPLARQLMNERRAAGGRHLEYFPLQLNSAGMMPLIFSSLLLYGLIPQMLTLLAPACDLPFRLWLVTPPGVALYIMLVFVMEFLPLGGMVPEEIAEYFIQLGVGIKGVAPGADTVSHLRATNLRVKFWGGACLAALALAARFLDGWSREQLRLDPSSTSLIIIVGAVLQASRQVMSLVEGPQLQQRLDRERQLIEGLAQL